MQRVWIVPYSIILIVMHVLGANAQEVCSPSLETTVNVSDRGVVRMWRESGALGFTSHMHVNADGAPNAYTVDNKGLSYICDGAVAYDGSACVDPGDAANWQQQCNDTYRQALEQNWNGPAQMCIFGFLATGAVVKNGRNVGGKPLLQGPDDPNPGAYISTTSLEIKQAPASTQHRYVNSNVVPFIVLPRGSLKKKRAKLGDVAAVYSWKTNKLSYAIVADTGPNWGLGEGSIALHKDLGNEPIVDRSGTLRAKRGIASDVTYLVFSGSQVPSNPDQAQWVKEIQTIGAQALSSWGGLDKMKMCAQEQS